MSEHARLSPSGAHRWMRCPGSLGLEEKLPPQGDNKYTAEGTAAHELAEMTLLSDQQDVWRFEDQDLGNGFEATAEMCGYVDKYVEDVLQYAKGHTLHIEQRVDFSSAVGHDSAFGTADAIIVNSDGKEIQVHDLKYGRGVQVFAAENEQLMLYALGAVLKHDVLDSVERVRMVIHQPRLHHLDEWDCSIEDLREFADRARTKASLAIRHADGKLNPLTEDIFHPGEKQCHWCRAKSHCPMMKGFVEDVVGVTFDNLDEESDELTKSIDALTTEQLAQIMPLLDLIVDWTKAIRGRVEHELLAGIPVPGYKLVAGKKGARQWKSPDEVEDLMKKSMRLSDDLMYSKKLISPTQAEKLLKKENPKRWERLGDHITQRQGEPSVAPESDRRPALNPAAEFENIDAHDLL